MGILVVDQKTCTQCGICAGVCPAGIIDFHPETYPAPGPAMEAMCLRCGHCVAACPSGSLTHRDMPVAGFPPIQSELIITAAQTEQFLRARRSIRVYQDRAVSRDLITRLIEIARYAPTGHNNQGVEWMVVDNKVELLRLEKIAVDWIKVMIKQSPQMAAAMNFEGMLVKQEKDYNGFLRGAPALIVTHSTKNNPMALIDCTIAMTYLELAATTLGLGACWAGLVYAMTNNFPPAQEALALPAGHASYGCMMLGYPKYKYARLTSRKTPNILWHQ